MNLDESFERAKQKELEEMQAYIDPKKLKKDPVQECDALFRQAIRSMAGWDEADLYDGESGV